MRLMNNDIIIADLIKFGPFSQVHQPPKVLPIDPVAVGTAASVLTLLYRTLALRLALPPVVSERVLKRVYVWHTVYVVFGVVAMWFLVRARAEASGFWCSDASQAETCWLIRHVNYD